MVFKRNFLAFKKANSKCASINKKAKKDFFKEAIKNGLNNTG